jgi:isoamylase
VHFTVPEGINTPTWQVVVDTSGDDLDDEVPWENGKTHEMPPRAVVVLQGVPREQLS